MTLDSFRADGEDRRRLTRPRSPSPPPPPRKPGAAVSTAEATTSICGAAAAKKGVKTTSGSLGSGFRQNFLARLSQFGRSKSLGKGVGLSIGSGIGVGSNDGCLHFGLRDYMDPTTSLGPFVPEAPTKVLILYKTTGGGHKASAQALKDAFEEKYGRKIQVTMLDVLPLCNPPFNKSDMYYDFMVKHPFLWRGAFAWSSTRWGERVGFAWYKVGLVDNLKKFFVESRPDLVVSVHPLLQVPSLAALNAVEREQHEPKRIPFATVVTDYTTCHATWFDKGVDKCFVPTVETREFGERRGLTASQLVMHGLPIRPAFSRLQASKTRIRQKLKIQRKVHTVLIVGGGDGMGPVEETCVALDNRFRPGEGQIVVICGRNKALARKLNKRTWSSKVVVLGFVSNMHEWMSASDCIITKAGPGTIAESLACGLPIMLNNFIPCQEAGNIPWVIDNKVGDYSNEPEEVASTVLKWFDKGLKQMRRRALALGRPEATFQIVDDLVRLIAENKWEPFKAGLITKEIKKFAAV